jgi:hypothetical protein
VLAGAAGLGQRDQGGQQADRDVEGGREALLEQFEAMLVAFGRVGDSGHIRHDER